MRDIRAHLEAASGHLSKAEKGVFQSLLKHGTPEPLDYTIELGLRVLERVASLSDSARELRAIDGWTLFGGYPFAREAGIITGPRSDEIVGILRAARHHLEAMHRRATWHSGLERYLTLPELVRGYSIPDLSRPAEWRSPSRAANRRDIYDVLLSSSPPFRTSPLKPAEPGPHRFRSPRIGTENVVIPDDLPDTDVSEFDLTSSPSRAEFTVAVKELEDTARAMVGLDLRETSEGERRHDDWERRFHSMELFTMDGSEDRFTKADKLVVDGLLHLIGIPGVGKSTLRDIVAAHTVVDRHEHVTLVVGDVSEALRVVERFNRMGRAARQKVLEGDARYERWARLHAAPIIGSSTREQHTARLHRRVGQIYDSPLAHYDEAFAHMSTACPLSALRGTEASDPLPFADAPCQSLIPISRPDSSGPLAEPEELGVRRGCPLWGRCPRHDTSRDLRTATIWVATPESLAITSLPRHQNAERVRYLELACHTSGMFIVDEADQVQIRLDQVFAPTATLYKPGNDSWLDELDRHKVAELAQAGRVQLADGDVDQWTSALDTVSTTADRIYAMLVKDEQLRTWVGADFFSVWSLQLELVNRWPTTRSSDDVMRAEKVGTTRAETARLLDRLSPDRVAAPDSEQREHTTGPRSDDTRQAGRKEKRDEVLAILDGFRDDPVGDRDEALSDDPEPDPQSLRLADLARRLLTNRPGNPRVARELEAALCALTGLRNPGTIPDAEWGSAEERNNVRSEFEQERRRFEFTLLLAVMHDRLNLLTMLWPRVEAALKLEASGNELYRRSPPDYAPHIPESPMGNILAFQFLTERFGDSAHTGELRFFQCTGVGRELLRALPSLGSADGGRGPNVILMSGTSWAGASTRYHVAEDVRAVLSARPDEGRRSTASGNALPSRNRTPEDASGPRVTMHPAFVLGRPPSSPPDAPKRPLRLSGTPLEDRNDILRQMVRGLARPDPESTDGRSRFKAEIALLPLQRRHLLVLVGSYKDARLVAEEINATADWHGKVCALISDDEDLPTDSRSSDPDVSSSVPVLRRGDLAGFRDTGRTILVAPLLSVERGHNILNRSEEAIFGSVYFLSRPFPQPGDIGVLVHALNDLTVRRTLPGGRFGDVVQQHEYLDDAGLAWRREARRELRRLANRQLSWKSLSEEDREYLTWDLLVVLWQVIGRLTRGGVDARVHFVDAAFAPNMAEGGAKDTARTSLLVSMRDVLAPYFGDAPPRTRGGTPQHRLPVRPSTEYLAGALYRPLYNALVELLGRPSPATERSARGAR
ncbi:pPIWI_RE_Z domain-containing protein [Nocardiopsis chromatogenes]|uniref:pPIWI_RE_Z domain-containing protein n=1 Tax=Nocardiopsis chromatogenes TaxID=280239 RepID=UPI00034985BA|nr:hypothetical protein [Nocardiopsis chromatogenes]